MRDVSLHILDLVQNSIAANATEILILINENIADNLLAIEIKDNGCGMTEAQLKKVGDPFYTTRKTRSVGFGIAFFKEIANRCDGQLKINSKSGKGTTIKVELAYHHVDRPPIGDMSETMQILVMGNPKIHFLYTHKLGDKVFEFDSCKYELSESNLNYETLTAIKNDISTGLKSLAE